MKQLATNHKSEQAAEIRDKITRLEYVTQQFRDTKEYIRNPNLIEDIREKEVGILKTVLGRYLKFPR